MNSTAPFVSVIVPVYGKNEWLGETLSALQEQSYSGDGYEVIIVDNGAHDALNSLITDRGNVVLIKHSTPGSYSARNAGLLHAKGEIIAFTDSDCIPKYNWIEQGVRAMQMTSETGLVAGKVEVFFVSQARPTATEVYDSMVSFPQRLTIERYHYGATANLFTRRNVISRVGDFDSSRFSGGDSEWGQRVYDAGFIQEYSEEAVVRHPARKSAADLIQKSRRVTIGTMRSNVDIDGKTLALSSFYYHLIRRPCDLWTEMSGNRHDYDLSIKVKVIGIYYLIKMLQSIERVRVVVFGGKPRR